MNELFDQLVESAGVVEGALSPTHIAGRLAAALFAGWVLGFAYRRTHTGDALDVGIPHAQILLSLGGALIWLIVADNLVRAFGLAGTIGLIRFRTRIRDPKDTTVLFFSMILGMACGLGQFWIAGMGTAFVSATLVGMSVSHRRQQQSWAADSKELGNALGIDDNDRD